MTVSTDIRRRRLTVTLALLGFFIAAFAGVYAQLSDSSPPHFNFAVWAALVILCPPSLVFVALIDVEPGTVDFALTWVAIAAINSATYAVISLALRALIWRTSDQGSNSVNP